MKVTNLVVTIVLAFAASTALGQVSDDNEIHGSGTARFIPQFTGSHRLGNSLIFQSAKAHIGIGTTTPNGKFTVFDTDNSIFSGLQPVAIYGNTSSNLGFASWRSRRCDERGRHWRSGSKF